MENHTLRPGLLVSMKTSLEGGVSYSKKDILRPYRDENGAQKAKWETVRTIVDPAEHDRAIKVRSKVRSLIVAECARSAFGLLCTQDNAEKLERAVNRAKELAKEFNEASTVSKINFYVITGRIEPNDAEAIRAIHSEVADLIADMQAGLKNLNVKAVREAANKARSVAEMLTGAASDKVSEAIAKARAAATKLVKAGEAAAVAIDHEVLQSLAEARTMFLEVNAKSDVEAPEGEARAIDLENDPYGINDAARNIPELTEEQSAEIAAGIDLPDLELTETESE